MRVPLFRQGSLAYVRVGRLDTQIALKIPFYMRWGTHGVVPVVE